MQVSELVYRQEVGGGGLGEGSWREEEREKGEGVRRR